MNDVTKLRWSTVDAPAAKALTDATNAPGVVYPVATTAIPSKIQKMAGIVSYYVSGYVMPQVLDQTLTVGGEMVVARTDEEITKNYNFIFASSSDGSVVFAGPFKGYGHHLSVGQTVQIVSLFGQGPVKGQ